jgi:tetratricopeptide (TPR) repeat protein
MVESSYRRLMRLHARSGERAKALHVYHRCVSVLQEELQIGPSDETVALYEDVLRLAPEGGAPEASAPSGSPLIAGVPLVGRRRELGQLRDAWAEARGGKPGLVFVTGDSGIGKTRLVEDFARSLPSRETAVIATHCHATERSLAFAPLIALLHSPVVKNALQGLEPVWRQEASRLLPELGGDANRATSPLAEGWQRRRLFEALAHAMLASQPLVAIVDDVHWCDGDTLDWLHYLLRFGTNARFMLVLTARTHELDDNPRLQSMLEDLEPDALVTRIELAPLAAEETTILARSLHQHDPEAEALASVVEQTEGNPLFVVEMVREGALPTSTPAIARQDAPTTTLPRRLRAVIASRLARLTPNSSELLGMAAVIGRAFYFDLLVLVSRQDEDAVVRSLDELWRRRIVRELGAGTYDFSHDKLREVAYGELSLTRRRLLHRYTAEALEALDAGEREGVHGRIAFHYDRAGYAERAITYYQRAAVAARSLYAHAEALFSYRRGLELVDELAPSATLERWRRLVAGELSEGLGDIVALQGLHEDARERFERALEHRRGDAVGCARLWRKIGLTWTSQYRYDEARRAFEAAEAALGSAGTAAGEDWWREWIDIRLERSIMHYWQLDWRECGRVLASLEHAVDQHASALQRGRYFRALADKDFAERGCTVSAQRLEYSRAALAAVEASGSLPAVAVARFGLGFSYLWHGDLDQAVEQLEAALSMSESMGNLVLRVRCLTYLAFVHRKRGDAAATQHYAMEGCAAARALTMPEYVGAARGQLAWLAWRRERYGVSRREGRAALRSWATGQRYPLQWCARLPLIAVSLTQDRLSEAVANAVALLDPFQQRLPDDLTEALGCAVRAESDPDAARSALLRSVTVAQEARLL